MKRDENAPVCSHQLSFTHRALRQQQVNPLHAWGARALGDTPGQGNHLLKNNTLEKYEIFILT